MKVFFLGIFFLFFALPIVGAENKKTHEIDITKAVKIALEKNASIRAKQLDFETAEADTKGYFAKALPSLKFNSTGIYNLQLTESLLPAIIFDKDAPADSFLSVAFGTELNLTNSLTLNQPLFDFAVFVAMETSRLYKNWVKKGLEMQKEEVILETNRAYFLNLVVKEQKKSLELIQKDFDSIFYQAKMYYEQGFIESVDLLAIEIEKNNISNSLKNAKNLNKTTENVLKITLGIPLEDTIKILDTFDKLKILADAKQVLNYGGETEYTNRKDFQALELNTALQRKNKKYSASFFFPTLDLIGAYNLNYGSNEFSKLFDVKLEGYYLGLSLSFDLFNGLNQWQDYKKSKLNLEKTLIEKDNAVKRMKNEIISLRSEVEQSVNDFGTKEANLKLQKKIFDYNTIKLREGIASYQDLAKSEADYQNASVEFYNSLYTVIIKTLELKKSIGKLN